MKKPSERTKLNIFKTLLFVCAFTVAFLPATVSRSREVNSRVIVEMLGVDGGEDGVEITAQYVMPTETEGATSKDKVTVSAKNITQAVEMLSTSLGRRTELGHCSMVIVGDKAEPDLFGTLMTATDITADVYMSAAQGKASELISDLTDFMKKTGATDADFIAYGAKKAHVATNTLLGFLSDLGSASGTAFLPVVEMLEDSGGSGGESSSGGSSGGSESSSGGSGGESSSGGSGGSGGGEKTGMKVEKLALYSKDGRVGTLDRDGARGVAWVSAPVKNGVVTADIERDGKKECMSGRLLKKRARIKADGDGLHATVVVDATIEPNCNTYISIESEERAENDEEVKQAFSAAIEKELRSGYGQALELGTDPLFIVRQFYRYAPDAASALGIGDIAVDFDVRVTLK